MLGQHILLSAVEQTELRVVCVNRAGRIRAATPAFQRFAAPLEVQLNASVTAWLPALDEADWAKLWLELERTGVTKVRTTWHGQDSRAPAIQLQLRYVRVEGEEPVAAVLVVDVDDRLESGQLQALHQDVLAAVMSGHRLDRVMDQLCRHVETMASDLVCSVLLVDGHGRLHPLAGPSLPEGFSRSLDGVVVGPDVGSCGAAIHHGEAVGATDIDSDPRWQAYKALPLAAGLRACWSTPIKARDDKVIGAFAFYYRTPRGPSAFERRIVDACIHLCAVAIENTEAQAQAYHLAHYDPLTKLPNRTLFQTKVNEVLARGEPFALLIVDLDDFKTMNDTLGLDIGDKVLHAVSEHLRLVIRRDDVVARFGGDEFAILQMDCREGHDAARLAERVIEALHVPLHVEGHQVIIGASIGITVAPKDGGSAGELLKNADLALYRAKREGRNTFRFFKPKMYERIRARLALEMDLRKALPNGELELFYQPFVRTDDKGLAGFEALLRWRHPRRGLLTAGEFIGVAEEIGLIVPLSDWILREACYWARGWSDDIALAVNLSPVQFRSGRVVESVAEALAETGFPPNRLELEITESVLMAEDSITQQALRRLRDLGARISLDDFGIGYSSLSYLRSFRFDKVKIDRSFIQDLPHKRDSAAIIQAISGLARDLGMTTTAEGVETEQQLDWLAEAGITEAQGYYINRPRPGSEVIALYPDNLAAA